MKYPLRLRTTLSRTAMLAALVGVWTLPLTPAAGGPATGTSPRDIFEKAYQACYTSADEKQTLRRFISALDAGIHCPTLYSDTDLTEGMLNPLLGVHEQSDSISMALLGCYAFFSSEVPPQAKKELSALFTTYKLLDGKLNDDAKCVRLAVDRAPTQKMQANVARAFLGLQMIDGFTNPQAIDDQRLLLGIALLDLAARHGHEKAAELVHTFCERNHHLPPEESKTLRSTQAFHMFNDAWQPEVQEEKVLAATRLLVPEQTPASDTGLIVSPEQLAQLQHLVENTEETPSTRLRAGLLLDAVMWEPLLAKYYIATTASEGLEHLTQLIGPAGTDTGLKRSPSLDHLIEGIRSKIQTSDCRSQALCKYLHLLHILTRYSPNDALDGVLEERLPALDHALVTHFLARCFFHGHQNCPPTQWNKMRMLAHVHALTNFAIKDLPEAADACHQLLTQCRKKLAEGNERATKELRLLYSGSDTSFDAEHLQEDSLLKSLDQLVPKDPVHPSTMPISPLTAKPSKLKRQNALSKAERKKQEDATVTAALARMGITSDCGSSAAAAGANGKKSKPSSKSANNPPKTPYLTKKQRKAAAAAALAAQKQPQKPVLPERENEEDSAQEAVQNEEAERQEEGDAHSQEEEQDKAVCLHAIPDAEQGQRRTPSPAFTSTNYLETDLPATAQANEIGMHSDSSNNAPHSPSHDGASAASSLTISQPSNATSPRSSSQDQGTGTDAPIVQDLNRVLFWRASSGHVAAVENIIKQHRHTLDLQWADEEGNTALHRSCAIGNDAISILLVLNGFKQQLNQRDQLPEDIVYRLHGPGAPLLPFLQQHAPHPRERPLYAPMPGAPAPMMQPEQLHGIPNPMAHFMNHPHTMPCMMHPTPMHPGYGINPMMMMQATQLPPLGHPGYGMYRMMMPPPQGPTPTPWPPYPAPYGAAQEQ